MKRWWWLLVGVAGIYLQVAPRDITGVADADELVFNGYNWGLNHPPGYAMYTGLLALVTKLPFGNEVYFKASALTIGFTVLTLTLIYLVLTEFKVKFGLKLVTLLALAANPLFWQYSVIPEVFALHHTLLMLLVWLYVKKYRLFWMLLVFSVALYHHQLAILILPLIIFPKVKYKPKEILIGLVFLLIFSLFNFGMIRFLAKNQVEGSWYLGSTGKNYVNFITRKAYSGLLIETGAIHQAYGTKFDLAEIGHSLAIYGGTVLPKHFGGLMILVILGLWQLRRKWKLFWRETLVLGFYTVGIAGYLSLPLKGSEEYKQAMQLAERMYIFGEILLTLLIPVGIKVLTNKFNYKWVVLVTLGLIGQRGINNLHTLNFNKPSEIALKTRNVLTLVPAQARLMCFTDESCFGLRYRLGVDKLRPDVTLIPSNIQMAATVLTKKPEMEHWGYRDNPFMVADIIAKAKMEAKPVVLIEAEPFYVDILGLNQETWPLISTPYGHLVVTSEAKYSAEEMYQKGLAQKQNNEVNGLGWLWWATLSEPKKVDFRVSWAEAMEKAGAPELAKREYEHALSIEPQNEAALRGWERTKDSPPLPSLLD